MDEGTVLLAPEWDLIVRVESSRAVTLAVLPVVGSGSPAAGSEKALPDGARIW